MKPTEHKTVQARILKYAEEKEVQSTLLRCCGCPPDGELSSVQKTLNDSKYS